MGLRACEYAARCALCWPGVGAERGARVALRQSEGEVATASAQVEDVARRRIPPREPLQHPADLRPLLAVQILGA